MSLYKWYDPLYGREEQQDITLDHARNQRSCGMFMTFLTFSRMFTWKKSRARLLSLVFLLDMIKCFCVLCYKIHKLMLHGVVRLTCRPLPGSWCFSIWSLSALWVQRGEPAVLSGLWALQTFVHQLQPAKESQRHLRNLHPARSPPRGTHVHTQSYWLHWAACLLGTGIVIQVLFIFSSFSIANCFTAQSLSVLSTSLCGWFRFDVTAFHQ